MLRALTMVQMVYREDQRSLTTTSKKTTMNSATGSIDSMDSYTK
jgi:hypothetical protein